MTIGLPELERRIAQDLRRIAHPNRLWVPPAAAPDGRPVRNVLVIGAGHSGLGIAFALGRARIDNVLVVDARPAGTEGPWRTYARMDTLRTAKDLIGPDGDLPNLTFQAWFEAQHGEDAWAAMTLIPREMWADYLLWFRRILDVPVENGVRVLSLSGEGPYVRAEIERDGKRDHILAREVVIATGFDGSGGAQIPEALVANLPRTLWAHTSDEAIDPAHFRGRRVGVLGAGASAFDNAIWALENGASEAHLFVRRPSLPAINFMRGVEYAGFFRHFPELDDARRWRFMRVMFSLSTPPPPATLEKARATPGFHMHLGCPWQSARAIGHEAEVETPQGRHRFAFLIFGTGYAMDVRRQPELAACADNIALWRDRYAPTSGEESETLARQPYLGPGFELLEKTPGRTPWFAHVRYWAIASWGSMGPAAVGLNGYKYGLPRLIDGIGRSLFLADADAHYDAYLATARPAP